MLLNPSAAMAWHRRGRPVGRQQLKMIEFRALGEIPCSAKFLCNNSKVLFFRDTNTSGRESTWNPSILFICFYLLLIHLVIYHWLLVVHFPLGARHTVTGCQEGLCVPWIVVRFSQLSFWCFAILISKNPTASACWSLPGLQRREGKEG